MADRPVPRSMDDAGLPCPGCGGVWHRTTDSRPSGNEWRRRRECKTCGLRFTTVEQVVARKARPFQPQTVRAYLENALKHLERAEARP
jgi:transcriptional regulator NrdR family protein